MGKKLRYSFDYDVASAYNSASALLGMNLRPHGDHLEGGYYLNGEPHPYRSEKLKVFVSRGSVWVMEEGGRCISLPQWLIEFGGAADYKDALRMIKGGSAPIHWEYKEAQPKAVPVVRYVDMDVLRGARAFPLEMSPLFRWMCTLFDENDVREVWKAYNVTADNRGRTCFWYLTAEGKIAHDKKIYYREDGHRDKEKPMGRDYRIKDGYTGRCFFGAHLIPHEGEICCVESEKTALLCALAYPSKVWVATGGKANLRGIDARFSLYPDLDGIEDWSGKDGALCEWWHLWALPEPERPHNADIGDMIVWDIQNRKI